MTIRLSTISFAGTARTLVAVGIVKLVSIFVTTRAAGPFNFSASGFGALTGLGAFGTGCVTGAETTGAFCTTGAV